MRILLMNDQIPPEGKGGAESVVWRLAQGLKSAGHIVHIVATTPNTSFEDVRDGIQTYHIQAGYPKRFRAWLSLYNPQTIAPFRNVIQNLKPDVVNAHNIHFQLSYHTLKVAHDAGIPTVFSAHDVMPFAYTKLTHFIDPAHSGVTNPQDYRLPARYNLKQNRLRYNPFRNPIIRRYLRKFADIRTAPSKALRDALMANDLPLFEIVHNGIDLEAWASVDAVQVESLRVRLGLAGKKVILFAGRLTSHKGTQQLLAAMDQLKDDVPDMRLLVLTAGDIDGQIPPEYAHLRPLIVKGGWLSGDELVTAYHLADVAVVPSVIFDSFPTVNLEAMACALPVIATSFGGSREIVLDGDTGFIVNPYDTVSFADRLRRLLTDEDLRQQMGLSGQARIYQQFSLKHQIDRMVAFYDQAITLKASKRIG